MPRNVSRSPHELVTYTLRFIFTLRACSKGRADSGRSLSIVLEQIFKRRAIGPPFLFFARSISGQSHWRSYLWAGSNLFFRLSFVSYSPSGLNRVSVLPKRHRFYPENKGLCSKLKRRPTHFPDSVLAIHFGSRPNPRRMLESQRPDYVDSVMLFVAASEVLLRG